METIYNIFSWWYRENPQLGNFSNGMFYTFWVVLFFGVILILFAAWDTGTDDMVELLTLPLVGVIGVPLVTLLTALLIPAILVFGILGLICLIFGKWGKNYRELEKSKDKRREEALATLLKHDPDLLDRYNKMMKDTEKLLDDN